MTHDPQLISWPLLATYVQVVEVMRGLPLPHLSGCMLMSGLGGGGEEGWEGGGALLEPDYSGLRALMG